MSSRRIQRTEFTDAQKAEIYVRDRATCCFSGANLWLLDAPLRPGYERDWVDHVRPSARGGRSDLANGVCASHSFNAKKRNNTADSSYLFEEGLPTYLYRDIFGVLSNEQQARLRRLSNLRASDWYFNRAIGQVLLGFDYRCRLERYDEEPSRDDRYWFGAAYRKLRQFWRFDCEESLEDRGLVVAPSKFVQSWLKLRTTVSEQEFIMVVDSIYPFYQVNFDAWASYFYDEESDTLAQRKRVVSEVKKTKGLTEDTLQCIIEDYSMRKVQNG